MHKVSSLAMRRISYISCYTQSTHYAQVLYRYNDHGKRRQFVLLAFKSKNQIFIILALYPFECHEWAVPISAALRQGPYNQGCNGV